MLHNTDGTQGVAASTLTPLRYAPPNLVSRLQ